jgi:NitT/TauT family transport system permease protein
MSTSTDPRGSARGEDNRGAGAVVAEAPEGGVTGLEDALDALEAPVELGPSRATRVRRAVVPPVVAIILLLAGWQLAFVLHIKPDWVLPSPRETWDELTSNWAQWEILRSVWDSVSRGLLGFAVSVVIGTPLGLLVGRIRPVRTAVGPILAGLQNLPSVAWVPAAIMWFGITPSTIYAVVLLGAVPSVATGLMSGLDQVPPLYPRVGRVLGARGASQVWFILLPAAMPSYFAGLKQGWAFAWRSLMAAELIAIAPQLGPGLGQLLEQGRDNNDMGQVFAAIGLIFLVGVGINALIFAPLERRVLRAHGLSGAQR